jgi:hypothetical protein
MFINTNFFEVFVCDNSSKDETCELLKYFKNKYGTKFNYFIQERTVSPAENILKSLVCASGSFRRLNNDTLIHESNSLVEMLHIVSKYNAHYIIYFSRNINKSYRYSADRYDFLKQLSNDLSWIGSFGIWKSDLKYLNEFPLFTSNLISGFSLFYLSKKSDYILSHCFANVRDLIFKGGYDFNEVFMYTYLKVFLDNKNIHGLNQFQLLKLMLGNLLFIYKWYARMILYPSKYKFGLKGIYFLKSIKRYPVFALPYILLFGFSFLIKIIREFKS